MLDELSAGPAPLMFPAPDGLAERVQMAAAHAMHTVRFGPDDVVRLRREGRKKANLLLPDDDADSTYIEMWCDHQGQARTVGALYSAGVVLVAVGDGWPGVGPKVLPGVLRVDAGGVVKIECAQEVRAAVFHQVAGFSGDVLRALDAVARGRTDLHQVMP
ncbi:hypothetical protein AAC691_12830 [Nguyenibacter vanlangensis]|uniref:DUF3806 domain-containing protein n=1 Tax=Nguyenibacter vanlangensis TaxID=1216886 RepID=A0ABZ3D0I7_9PROT